MAKKTETSVGGAEETQGSNLYGFQDPTGEFPRKDYWGESSVNRAARGAGGVGQKEKPNDLAMSATFPNIDMGLGTGKGEDFKSNTGRSKYPYNKVTETYSGHVIEIDDTEGNERILIRHREGSGIEMRKDGSIWISATKDKYETVGADCKIVVEGNTEIAYEGNLDMWVGGNFNLDVGGNHNVKIKGNRKTRIAKNNKTSVSGNHDHLTKGNAKISTMGISTDLCLGDLRKIITKGATNLAGEGPVDVVSDETVLISGQKESVMTSQACNISGITVSALGMKGTFGGDFVDFCGKTYSGPLGPQPLSGATFFGSVIGTATGAINAWTAMSSTVAGSASSLGAGGFGVPPVPPSPVPTPPSGPPPNAGIVGLHLAGGAYAIRTVTVDAGGTLKSKILKTDSYGGVFGDDDVSTQDLRGAMRDEENTDKLFTEGAKDGKLNPESTDTTPPDIGRTAGKGKTTQFGDTPLGNTTEGQGKNFTANDPIYTKKVGEKLTKEELLRAATGSGGGGG